MNKKLLAKACLLALFALLASYQTALAHEHVTVGDYEIEVGWVNEPPLAGQLNGIVVNVSKASTSEAQPVEDVSGLKVTISYGGQSRELSLEPQGEETPGHFKAPVLPAVPGKYTVILGGQLGDTAVDAPVEVEEVMPADTIQFPSSQPAAPSAEFGTINWLLYFSLLIGLIALILAVMALRKAG